MARSIGHRQGENVLTVSGAVTRSIFQTSVVRVVGLRRGRFVEFNFSPADPILEIDLIMPASALAEFCRDNNAAVFVANAALAEDFTKLCIKQGAWELLNRLRQGQPTLADGSQSPIDQTKPDPKIVRLRK